MEKRKRGLQHPQYDEDYFYLQNRPERELLMLGRLIERLAELLDMLGQGSADNVEEDGE